MYPLILIDYKYNQYKFSDKIQLSQQIMLAKDSKYKNICQKDQYTIYVQRKQDQLHLRIFYKVSRSQYTQYDLKINQLKSYGIIYNYCEDFQTFIQFIRDPNCTSFNAQQGCLLVKELNRFGRVIQLATFKFEKAITTKQQTLIKQIQQIALRYSDNKSLSNQQIHQAFGPILNLILFLYRDLDQIRSGVNIPNQNILKPSKQNKTNQLCGQVVKEDEKLAQAKKQISQIRVQLQKICQQKVSLKDFQLKTSNLLNKFQSQTIETILKSEGSIYQQLSGAVQRTQEKLILLSQEMQKKSDKLAQRLQNIEHFINFTSDMSPIKGIELIDPFCPSAKNLIFNDNIVTNKKEGYCYIFCRYVIIGSKPFSLYFKFNRIMDFVRFGIADIDYKLKHNVGENCITYSSSGSCYVGFNNKFGTTTKGFKEGQIVQLVVNLAAGNIQWKVQGLVRNRIQACPTMTKNLNVNWVPFIYLNSKGDSFSVYR